MTVAGWYPDGAGQVRFWDGAEWTPYTSIPAYDAIGRSDPRILPPPSLAAEVAILPPLPPAPDAVARGARDAVGLAGLLVGLVSVFLPFLLGLAGGILGLALSIAGLSRPGGARGVAIAGIAVSILAIVLIV